jgi:hypothetical protein
MRDGLNLEAEALAQLTRRSRPASTTGTPKGRPRWPRAPTTCASACACSTWGLTRAKRELVVTWNTGRQGDAQPSLAMQALMGFFEK